jgi:hypothetical protein
MTICDNLATYYNNSGGAPIYGDPTLFFQAQGGCNPVGDQALIFNRFCGTPTSISAFLTDCNNLFITNQDNAGLVLNQILQQTWPDFGLTAVPQFASICGPLDFSTIPYAGDLQSSFSGNVSAAVSGSGQLYTATTQSIQFHPASPINVQAFGIVGQTGLIYYLDATFIMHSFNALTNVDTMLGSDALIPTPVLMRANSIGTSVFVLATSLGSVTIETFDVTTQSWQTPILTGANAPPKFALALDYIGSTMVVGDTQNLFLNTGSGFQAKFQSLGVFRSCGSIIVNGQLPVVMEDGSGDQLLYLCDLQQLTSVSIPLPPNPGAPHFNFLDWNSQGFNWVTSINNDGIWWCPQQPTSSSDWIHLSTQEGGGGGTKVAIPTLRPIVYWITYINATSKASIRCASTSPNPLAFFINTMTANGVVILLDNGEIRAYDSLGFQELRWISTTNDQSLPSDTLIATNKYIQVQPNINPITISLNGFYALSALQGQAILLQNIINQPSMELWSALNTQRQAEAITNGYPLNYCGNLPKDGQVGAFKNTFPDPRCLCYYPDELVAAMFNVDLLKSNPVQLKEMEAIAPCTSTTCTLERGLTSVTGYFMTDVVQCPSSIAICTTLLNIGTGGEIDTGVVSVSNNCGSAGTNGVPCSSTCPLGSACAKNNFCASICSVNSDCLGAGEECIDKVCQQPEKVPPSTGFPTWAIAIIVVVVVLGFVGIGLGVYYTRKNRVKPSVTTLTKS